LVHFPFSDSDPMLNGKDPVPSTASSAPPSLNSSPISSPTLQILNRGLQTLDIKTNNISVMPESSTGIPPGGIEVGGIKPCRLVTVADSGHIPSPLFVHHIIEATEQFKELIRSPYIFSRSSLGFQLSSNSSSSSSSSSNSNPVGSTTISSSLSPPSQQPQPTFLTRPPIQNKPPPNSSLPSIPKISPVTSISSVAKNPIKKNKKLQPSDPLSLSASQLNLIQSQSNPFPNQTILLRPDQNHSS